jgi:large subunit ribosomal protein L9
MEVILLERVGKLGHMGDVVRVKDGFARNFLLPQGKALRATKENLAEFEGRRAHLEATNLERRKDAEAVAEKLSGQVFTLIRQASDAGQLYGSVSTRDLADAMHAGGFTVERTQILLDRPIKTLGLHPITIRLHPEVEITVSANVARTEEEAERQARGEDVTRDRGDEDEAAEEELRQARAEAEALFENADTAEDAS